MASRKRAAAKPDRMPLADRLSAFLDGELPEAERSATKALLASDPRARDLLDKLRLGSQTGNTLFNALLKDPMPLALMRTIRGRKSTGR